MLSKILKEHQTKQASDKVEVERLGKDASTAVTNLTDCIADTLNVRVASAFKAQRDLEAESKHFQAATSQFIRQSRQWFTIINEFDSALKELGDVKTWSHTIEKDVRDICLTIESAHDE
ncbi:GCN5-like 1 [Phlyctochytrium arcticum]|nr:GCN5-like 1 [Phlyctochytrium arcticum]